MPLPHAFDVLVKQSLDDLLSKIASPHCPRAEEQILGHLAEIEAKPLVQLDPEPHLGTFDDLPGQEVPDRSLEDILFGRSAQLHMRREARAELHEGVIEHGGAPLQPVGHGGDVHLDQQVLGEVGVDIHIEARVDKVRRIGGSIHIQEEFYGISPPCCL